MTEGVCKTDTEWCRRGGDCRRVWAGVLLSPDCDVICLWVSDCHISGGSLTWLMGKAEDSRSSMGADGGQETHLLLVDGPRGGTFFLDGGVTCAAVITFIIIEGLPSPHRSHRSHRPWRAGAGAGREGGRKGGGGT